jgi:hypothetical protein
VNAKSGETAVEGVSAKLARNLTYAVKAWAGQLAEFMGSLHKLLSAPVQWTGRLRSYVMGTGSVLHRDSNQMWLRDPVQAPVHFHYAAYQHSLSHDIVVERRRLPDNWTVRMVFSEYDDSSGGAVDHRRQLAYRHEATASGNDASIMTPRLKR